MVNAILARPCFQVTLKQESTRHFSVEFIFMRLHTSLLTKQVLVICACKAFLCLHILRHYIAEKMLFCMKSSLHLILSYTYIYENTEYPVLRHILHFMFQFTRNQILIISRATKGIFIQHNCSYIR